MSKQHGQKNQRARPSWTMKAISIPQTSLCGAGVWAAQGRMPLLIEVEVLLGAQLL